MHLTALACWGHRTESPVGDQITIIDRYIIAHPDLSWYHHQSQPRITYCFRGGHRSLTRLASKRCNDYLVPRQLSCEVCTELFWGRAATTTDSGWSLEKTYLENKILLMDQKPNFTLWFFWIISISSIGSKVSIIVCSICQCRNKWCTLCEANLSAIYVYSNNTWYETYILHIYHFCEKQYVYTYVWKYENDEWYMYINVYLNLNVFKYCSMDMNTYWFEYCSLIWKNVSMDHVVDSVSTAGISKWFCRYKWLQLWRFRMNKILHFGRVGGSATR